ncbi:23S rRNA pseudouridine(1911/1915/1917) synthase RluD [Thioalkalivibrio paradoxus]|uniref:Pseudouridine synthase n=1 Tax=Thioalkalivibrio paradoxus ARh 1 TaxID=713585 RepID=W0DQR8_9GAMM|nr:23S rRNA pseudouridine(1911/1915/1917) synthase RluD [Thioalkalivibrio paradoxus]AHE99185.1 23S rRNA pseudouridine synthase D [Thioalkalivibrio paradoxus ARh 1]
MTVGFYNNVPSPRAAVRARELQQEIPAELAGMRLDAALARVFDGYSRSQLTQWLKQGALTVDGSQPRPRDAVRGGERVRLRIPDAPASAAQPEAIALEVVHEDAAIVVINKPAGLVVHPAAGHREGTLVNALLHHAPELSALPRAGIVHRLDKDTTGLLVVARTPAAQTALVRQLQERSVHREYLALVQGVLISGGTLEAPIGRHPVDRKRMAVVAGGKPAVTHYRVRRRLRAHTLVEVRLDTGRTHQIRVHMAQIGHPVVGDPVYGGRPRPVRDMEPAAAQALAAFQRQALHAAVLGLRHPDTGAECRFEAPLPADFQALLDALVADATRAGGA